MHWSQWLRPILTSSTSICGYIQKTSRSTAGFGRRQPSRSLTPQPLDSTSILFRKAECCAVGAGISYVQASGMERLDPPAAGQAVQVPSWNMLAFNHAPMLTLSLTSAPCTHFNGRCRVASRPPVGKSTPLPPTSVRRISAP